LTPALTTGTLEQRENEWHSIVTPPKAVVDNIDELAFLLTGHRKFYHLKPHSTSCRSPSMPPPTLGDEEASG